MITELTKIINNQPTTKKILQTLKNKYFVIIYKGVLDGNTAKQIHKNLYNITINKKETLPDYKRLLDFAIKLTNRVKKIEETDTNLLAVAIINLFTKKAVNYKANIIINREIVREEDKQKKRILKTAYTQGRRTKQLFYIASSHNDCAKDHLPYQGKIYVDEKWKKFVDKEQIPQIEQYIANNNIKTVQWVTGAPVYFLTRPYCRHYFVQYNYENIASMKYKIPYRKIGNRTYQTARNGSYEYYKDRYDMLKELYKTYPTQTLKNLLLKTKILRDKWYEYGK